MPNPWNNPPPVTLSDPPASPYQQQLTSAYPNPTIFGDIDGTNPNFTWGVWFQTIKLYRNGLRQTIGSDYGAGPTALTFFPGAVPQPGDILTIEGFGTI